MPRTRLPDLGESWASEAYSNNGDDRDWQDESGSSEDEDQHTSLLTVDASTPRRSARLSSPVPGRPQPTSLETTPRRSIRTSSRNNSAEPHELVMPTIEVNARDSSWVDTRPLSASRLSSRGNTVTGSRVTSSSNATSRSRTARQQSLVASSVRRLPRSEQVIPERSPKLKSRRRQADSQTSVPSVATIWNIVSPPAYYIVSVVGMAFQIVKPFLALLLVAVLLATLASRWFGWIPAGISTNLAAAKAIVCEIPGASLIVSCPAAHTDIEKAELSDFHDLLRVQNTFQDVLSLSKEVRGLPAHVKQGELSVRQLKEIVKFSKLPSRNMLVLELTNFADQASLSAHDLSYLDTALGTAQDKVLMTNRWTLDVLEDARRAHAARGSISRFFESINPFSLSVSIDTKVRRQYIRHAESVERHVQGVIEKAARAEEDLKELDAYIERIAEVAAKDDESLRDDLDDLLSKLWTKLGGHGQTKKKIQDQLSLLRAVRSYNQMALHHVSATRLKLFSVMGVVNDLQERITAPGKFLETSDVKMEYFIENIRLGVERLEQVRKDNLKVQEDVKRSVTGKIHQVDEKGNLIDPDVRTASARIHGGEL